MWQNVLLVGAGGFVGSAGRYLTSVGLQHLVTKPWIPLGTLAVNVVGCFLIGLLAGLGESRQILSPEVRLLVLVGAFGGFTTFSTFGFETLNLAKDGEFTRAVLNIASHVIIGLFAVWLGDVLARLA